MYQAPAAIASPLPVRRDRGKCAESVTDRPTPRLLRADPPADPPAKAELRAAALRRRAQRAAEDVAARSGALARHLLADPRWQAARAVAGYVGVRGEPDTRPLLAAALAAGKRLWLPRMAGPRRDAIEFVALADLAALAPAPFGLLEPTGGPGVDLAAANVDLALVPGLAFTRAGARLGFGKAFYDRALAPLRDAPRPLRVAVCFADDLVEALPEEPHDVRVHVVATEHGLADRSG